MHCLLKSTKSIACHEVLHDLHDKDCQHQFCSELSHRFFLHQQMSVVSVHNELFGDTSQCLTMPLYIPSVIANGGLFSTQNEGGKFVS